MLQGNACSGEEDFFEGSEFSQTEFDWRAPKPSESGWGTHSAPDLRHPEEKLAVAIAGKLVMRPLWAASDVNRSSKDDAKTLMIPRILKPDCFTFTAFLCFAESVTRLDTRT